MVLLHKEARAGQSDTPFGATQSTREELARKKQ